MPATALGHVAFSSILLMPSAPWPSASTVAAAIRTARRPKPPSLKEQALSELNLTADPDGAELSRTQVELIRKALEALPDD